MHESPPDLRPKKPPLQERSRETVERILLAAAELLATEGIERLSTNLICERAGLTPPALYRYFPNKYAVLHALGERLMAVQNELLAEWAQPSTLQLPKHALAQRIEELFTATLALTREAPGGAWITRALRAVPDLHSVLSESHRHVAGLIETAFVAAYPSAPVAEVRALAHLSIELAYAVHERMLDDPGADTGVLVQTMAQMIANQIDVIRRGSLAHAS